MSTVQPISFQARTKYLSENAYNNMKSVLTKMNNNTGYINGGNVFSTSHLNRLKLRDDSAIIYDGRFLMKKVSADEQMQGTTLITTCNSQVEIDNKTGEIKGLDKPFFSTWSKVIKRIENVIQVFADNFENSNLVKRGYVSFIGHKKDGEVEIDTITDSMER